MANKQFKETPSPVRHYFIDEGGDSTLFSRSGKVLVGTEGCSRFFILGLLDVPNPTALQRRLDTLRMELVNDAYFNGVPSLQPNARKTALAFHAKDDLPEVRRDVFRLLRETEGLRFYAVVADKLSVLEYVRQRNRQEAAYRYRPHELYDSLSGYLFIERVSQHSQYEVIFSKLGKSTKPAALQKLVEAAWAPVGTQPDMSSDTAISVSAATPSEHGGLQAVDYFVWALQRLYERAEERYLAYLWPAVRLVHDRDDTREGGSGTRYTQNKPLTATALSERR